MGLQENTCTEIALLENYHEVGEQDGRNGEGWLQMVKYLRLPIRDTTSSVLSVTQTTSKYLLLKRKIVIAQALAQCSRVG